jgi:glycosyltransferase involved in cell wall biosynthesis
MQTTISDKITIVIPCKNEESYIGHLLEDLISQQVGSTRIIIADCSTDSTREVIDYYRPRLNIEVVEGGPVSYAKNSGASLATTPYILFIDADVRFFCSGVIQDAVDVVVGEGLDLVGLNIRCYDSDRRAQLGFKIFNFVNGLLKHYSPFAVGAFFLTRRDRFLELGGFSESLTTSEDYFLSRQYSVKKFKLLDQYFGQDSRRFQKMGYLGMAWYLIKNFWNRNDSEYWNRRDHNKYWN